MTLTTDSDLFGNCSSEELFPEIDASQFSVSSNQIALYETCADFLVAYTGVVAGESFNFAAVSDFATSLLVYNIWGTFMVIFLVCGALPLAICVFCKRCCCCENKSAYSLGYYAGGCRGYFFPTFAFLLNLTSMTFCAVVLPFAIQGLGGYLDKWLCMASAAFDTGSDLTSSAQNAVNDAFTLVSSTVAEIFSDLDFTSKEIISNVTSINRTVENVSISLYSGCTNTISSSAYQGLEELSSSFQPLDCEILADIAADVLKQIKEVDLIIDSAVQEIHNENTTVQQQIGMINKDINNELYRVQTLIKNYKNELLNNTTVTIDSPIFTFVLYPGVYSLQTVTDAITNSFKYLALWLDSFAFISALLWIWGIFILICAQCNMQKQPTVQHTAITAHNSICENHHHHYEREHNYHGTQFPTVPHSDFRHEPLLMPGATMPSSSRNTVITSRHRHGGCLAKCGRCMNRTACCFGFCNAICMAIASIIVLTLAPFAYDVISTYYVAPTRTSQTIDFFIQSGLIENISSELEANITTFVNTCILPEASNRSSSILVAAELVGFNLTAMITNALKIPSFNISQYGNVTLDVEDALVATESAQNTLTSDYAYSATDMQYAESAANECCNYENVFQQFVTNCNDSASLCHQCAATSVGTCTPGKKCDPATGSVQAKCKTIAGDALDVMNRLNTLVAAQQYKFNAMTSFLENIEALHIDEFVKNEINSVDALVPEVLAIGNAVSCSPVGWAYYGVYNAFLYPATNQISLCGILVTAIAFHSILLMSLTVVVNTRLGGGNNGNTSRSNERYAIALDLDELPVATQCVDFNLTSNRSEHRQHIDCEISSS
jgi:hypothetical protein